MAQRVGWIPMKMTIHPLFLPLLLGLVLYGNVSYYAIILSSLLIHEFGHIFACFLMKVKIRRCVIMPYGGEIELEGGYSIHPVKEFIIAIGGPIATFICFLIGNAPFFDPLLAEPFVKIQLVLLVINLFPICPLDGGRIVYSFILLFWKKAKVYEMYLLFSFLFILFGMFISFVFLPKSLFLFILTIFLFIQIVKEWRFRKYRIAFEKYVLNRLT